MKQTLFKSILVMLTALLSLPILADNSYQTLVDGILYRTESSHHDSLHIATVLGCDDMKTDINIPSSVVNNGMTYTVTGIGYEAFAGHENLISVSIPNTIEDIGIRAFMNCSSLTSINIPEGVKSIGGFAFYNCSSLTSIIIPKSMKSIGSSAFGSRDLLGDLDITINITDLEAWCKISMGDGNNYKLFLNGVEVTDLVIPNSVTSISAFSGCSSIVSVTIPNSVKGIDSRAFNGCHNLTSIVIPNSVTNIGYEAFSGCSNLSSVVIPNSVTNIGSRAFYDCSNLSSVVISNPETWISNDAFQYCYFDKSNFIYQDGNFIDSYGAVFCEETKEGVLIDNNTVIHARTKIVNAIIPEGVTSIRYNAFYGCSSLSSVVIPEGVTGIGSGAFYGCSSLSSVVIPESVNDIGAAAFEGCTSLPVVDNCIYVDNCLIKFVDKEATSCSIKEGTRLISGEAFYDCVGLTSIAIPNSVTGIGRAAFYGCSSIASIVIPENVTLIGEEAFAETKIKSVIVKCKQVPENIAHFSKATLNHAPLYVRAELYDDYAFGDYGWYSFINIKKFVDAPEDVESSKAYFLMNEANTRYVVYDAVNDKITTRESVADVDEENLNDNWTVVKVDGKQYLYNMGAKKFAKRDSSEIGFSLVEGLADMTGAAMRKAAGVNTFANILFVENGTLSADEAAKDIVTGIELVNAESGKEASIHSISGVKQSALSHGINIIRKSDGSVNKVFVK